MTSAGNPLQGSAIYKIEKGDPPRRITVDELVTFATVFELEPNEMLLPMKDVLTVEARRITDHVHKDLSALLGVINSLVTSHIAMFRLEASPHESDRKVLARVVELMPSASINYPMGPDNHPTRAHVSPDPISKAFIALGRAFMDYAQWFVKNEEGQK